MARIQLMLNPVTTAAAAAAIPTAAVTMSAKDSQVANLRSVTADLRCDNAGLTSDNARLRNETLVCMTVMVLYKKKC